MSIASFRYWPDALRRAVITIALLTMALSAVKMATAKEENDEDNNLLGLPEEAISNNGALMICGGGPLPEEVYEQFVELAGGSDARIVLIYK